MGSSGTDLFVRPLGCGQECGGGLLGRKSGLAKTSKTRYCPEMSTASERAKRVYPRPDILRRNVIEQLERLPDEGVAVLHDLAQELELRAAWADFSQGLEADWTAGKYADLNGALIAARESIKASQVG